MSSLAWDNQDQETFLEDSFDKQTCNYDRESSKHHPCQSTYGTGIEPQKDKMLNYIYENLPRNAIATSFHHKSGDSHCQKIFLAPGDK